MAKKGGFQPGNKCAVGHGYGRPQKYDLDKEAADLDEWSKRPDAQSLYHFTYDKDYLAQELSDFAERSEVFRLALNKAKERIARNRSDLCNKGLMDRTVWNRSAALYDKPLRDHEEWLKDRQAERDRGVKAADQASLASLISDAREGKIKQEDTVSIGIVDSQ